MSEANQMTLPQAAHDAPPGAPDSEELGSLSQWQLMSLRFRKLGRSRLGVSVLSGLDAVTF